MTSPASDPHGNGGAPPPLPPRPQSSSTICSARPDASLTAMSSHDPRSSSTQSLVPDPATEHTGRRRLLLVYVHGFMGDETSFRSFPAHVHNLVTITLADSHVVHTKIYPKYRSRFALEVARDDFSKWLTPHEDQWTDVVLLAHSMGGLIAADIAMLFRHRIIGVVNFDVPFLGMHPGIVKAGLGSIFKPWPTPEEQAIDDSSSGKKPSRMNTLFNPKPSDPNFNPSFYNDVHLPVRKGWENTLHWMSKHSNGLIQASKGLIKTHFEFGSAMADYPALKDRYARIRALEEDDERKRKSAIPETQSPPRIRFVNYYTASTGRPKKPKSPKSPSPSRPPSRGLQHQDSSTSVLASASHLELTHQRASSGGVEPRISVEVQEHRDNEVVPISPEEPLSATSPTTESQCQTLPPRVDSAPNLPEIPPIPQEPPFVDLTHYADKAQRRAAEKEHDQALKDYQRAVKARNKVIKERSRLEEKWEKQRQKAKAESGAVKDEKADSGHESGSLEEDIGAMQLGEDNNHQHQDVKSHSPYANYDFSRSTILNQAAPDDRVSVTDSVGQSSYADSMHTLTTVDTNATPDPEAPPKKKRLKKFCMLPPKDANGNKDPTWIRVFMEGIDEVTAHTTLFFVNATYERLVGDVGARIEDWVREADSMRLVREMEGLD